MRNAKGNFMKIKVRILIDIIIIGVCLCGISISYVTLGRGEVVDGIASVKVKQIRVGMTVDDVVDILGYPLFVWDAENKGFLEQNELIYVYGINHWGAYIARFNQLYISVHFRGGDVVEVYVKAYYGWVDGDLYVESLDNKYLSKSFDVDFDLGYRSARKIKTTHFQRGAQKGGGVKIGPKNKK